MTLAKRLQAISKFEHYSEHDKMVSALTEFDREQTKRAHMWNSHFLGIALQSLAEYQSEGGPLSDYFNDRALVAIQIALGQAQRF